MPRWGNTTEEAELISLLEHVLGPATNDMMQPQPAATTPITRQRAQHRSRCTLSPKRSGS
jgi:hypothetical protein